MPPERRVYLDHNATTPLDPQVIEAMLEVQHAGPGNASSLHSFGQAARARLETARACVARLVGTQPYDVIFTGSGTEADNLALTGVAWQAKESRRKIVYAAIEHHAVIHTAKALAEKGWPVVSVRALPDGRIDLDDLRAQVDDKTALVAVMLANNETGVIQPIAEVVALARERGALVHCDAVQAAGKLPLDFAALGVDSLALSAHKLRGPQGVGALVVRRGLRLATLLHGGGQERNRRAGTENILGIVGFGRAAELAVARLAGVHEVAARRDKFEAALVATAGAQVNGTAARVANTTNLSFADADGESLLMALDLQGVAVSTGSACAAGAVEPSHVLRAMGLPVARAQSSLRFSLGCETTEAELDFAARAVVGALAAAQAR